MLKKISVFFILFCALNSSAQNYNNILNYNFNGTPVNGVKIKTNLPFLTGVSMPTIMINGYSFGSNSPINLTLTFYVYHTGSDMTNSNNFYFHQQSVSSSAAYTPTIKLSNENGKVVIFLDDKDYYQRFTVSAYAQGMTGENITYFQGWTAVDEQLSGTKTVIVNYKNKFSGDVYLSGNGIWDKTGNVGIGTNSPKEKLSVNGKIRAHEIKVETQYWPDYVFQEDYPLKSLAKLADYIKIHKRLPDMPSAKDAEANGVDLGHINNLLLKKIEELTLYLIEKDLENKVQGLRIDRLEQSLNDLLNKR